MRLLWGDLHNHCGITYGLGGLENSLRAARAQLDFCSVTPHAFWPDMPERNDDTAFIIDFHKEGFLKIARNWRTYVDAIEAANAPGDFTTFFSFEMHSAQWGDHTFVSPDAGLKIAAKRTPREVVQANLPVPLVGIPHHIGYTPGYRGINWSGFDSSISPAVEVFSKHGCAMHEYAGAPYYHDMGPFDTRGSVFSGLARGCRFSFMASTDHHAGCPGSYGDGRMAVLAEANTREAIWDALLRGRTYGVTGDKIHCDFSVNGASFGESIAKGPARIAYSVRAGGAIDRVIVYRNLEPLRVVDGLLLPAEGNRFKIKIEFGWGANEEPYTWDVAASVAGGSLVDVEPCFRGRNMISPTQRLKDTDAVNDMNMAVVSRGDREVRLLCDTFRNVSTLHPSTSAVILEVEGSKETVLNVVLNGHAVSATVGQLLGDSLTGHMKSHSSNAYKIHPAVPSGQYCCEGEFADCEGGDFYHMEVVQRDGNRAFVSPVFMI